MARIYCCIDPANGCVLCRYEFDREMAPARWRTEQRQSDIINRQADEIRLRFALLAGRTRP